MDPGGCETSSKHDDQNADDEDSWMEPRRELDLAPASGGRKGEVGHISGSYADRRIIFVHVCLTHRPFERCCRVACIHYIKACTELSHTRRGGRILVLYETMTVRYHT